MSLQPDDRVRVSFLEKYALYLIVFIVEVGLGIVSPILPDIRRDFGLAAWEAGMMVTVFALARLITDLPLGMMLDRVDRVRVLMLGTFLITGGSLACGLAESYSLLLIARLVTGAGTALCLVTALFTVSRGAGSHARGRAIGIYQASLLAGVTISPMLGGIAATLGGWRASFLAGSAAGAVALILVVTVSRMGSLSFASPRKTEERQESQEPERVPAPAIQWNLVAINFTTFVFFASTSGFRNSMVPIFGGNELGMSAGTLGLILGGSAVIRFFITLGSGFASDRYGRKVILIPGTMLLAAGTLGFAMVDNPVAFTMCLFLLSLGGFGNSIPTTMVVDAVPPGRVGMSISINRFVGDLGMLAGPVALGLVLDSAGFPAVATITALLLASTIPGVALAVKEQRRRRK